MVRIVTLRTTNGDVTSKIWSLDSSSQLQKTNFNTPKYLLAEINEVDGPSEFFQFLEETRLAKDKFIVRGELLSHVDITRPIVRRKNGSSATLRDVDAHWIMLDIDKLPLPIDLDVINTPMECVEYAIKQLPSEFHTTNCYYQFSSSTGMDDNSKLSVHLWYWLDRPVDNKKLQLWAKATSNYIDSKVFEAIQPHYIANPVFKDGLIDPIKQRTGILKLGSDLLSINQDELETTAHLPLNQPSRSPSKINAKGYENKISLLGDHQGGDGFHEVIRGAIGSFIATNRHNSDQQINWLKQDIRERINKANQTSHSPADIDRYCSDDYLDELINGAFKKNYGTYIGDIEPHFNQPRLSRIEAAEELARVIQKFTEDVFYYNLNQGSQPYAPTLALRASAGSGKTTSIIKQCIDSGAISGYIDYYIPSHALGDEVARRMRQEFDYDYASLGYENLSQVRNIKGRDQTDTLGQPLCQKIEEVKKLQSNGISIQSNLCRNSNSPCEHLNDCLYQKQFAPLEIPKDDDGNPLDEALDINKLVRIFPHNYLFLPTPIDSHNRSVEDSQKMVTQLVVVDEKFWDKGIEELKIKLASFKDDHNELAALILYSLEAKQPLLDNLISNEVNIDTLLSAATQLRRSTNLPSDTDNLTSKRLQEIKQKSDLASVYGALADELKLGFTGYSRCISLSEETNEVILRKRKNLNIPDNVPVVFIDADLDKTILSKFRNNVVLKEISIERDADVFQITDRNFNNNSLLHDESSKELLDQSLAFIKNVAPTGETLLVTNKKLRCALTGEPDVRDLPAGFNFNGVGIAHFGQLRGINKFENYKNVIIVGRQQVPHKQLEEQAEGLFWDDPNPILKMTINNFEEAYRGHRGAMGQVIQSRVRVHPDPRVQALNEQSREAETGQAIDRLRLVRERDDSRRARVFILCNIPIDITVDHLFAWRDYQLFLEVLDKLDGVIPLNPEHFMEAYPDISGKTQAKEKIKRFREMMNTYNSILGREVLEIAKYRKSNRSRYSELIRTAGFI